MYFDFDKILHRQLRCVKCKKRGWYYPHLWSITNSGAMHVQCYKGVVTII